MLNYAELVNRDGSINWGKVPVDTPIKVKQKKIANGKTCALLSMNMELYMLGMMEKRAGL